MGASPMPYALCSMPYALCPMPYEHLMLLRKAILCYSPILRQIYRILVKVLRSHSDNYTEKKSRSAGEGGRAIAHIAQIRFTYSHLATSRHSRVDWPLVALR